MIKDDQLVKVRNRVNGSVGYTLDGGFHRTINTGETKQVPFKELRELQYAPGGEYALNNLLVVEDEEALKMLNMTVEPEYFYNEEKIKELLWTGSIDAFADFLDFAPEGAIEIAKDIAIKEQIPDVRKRDMISKKTGLNINNAIMVNEIMDSEDEETEEEPTKQRRVQVGETETKPAGRRVAVPEYKVVSKK